MVQSNKRSSIARNDLSWRLLRKWLLWTLTLISSAMLTCCFVPQQRMHPVQRRKQSIYHSFSILHMVPSEKASSVSPVRNNTTSSSSNRRVGAPQKNKKVALVQNKRQAPNNNKYNTTASQQENNSFKVATKLEEMQQRANKGENMTQSYCDSVLALCVACDEWDSVLDVLAVMKQQGLSQQRSTYRASLQTCFEFSNGASASEIVYAMRQAGEPPETTDISLAVLAMCQNEQTERNKWWKRAMTLLMDTAKQEIGIVPVEAYDAVLSCIPHQNWRDAVRLLHLMEQDEYHPSPILSSYRVVIATCVAAQQAEQAFQMLTSMPSKGLKPTVFSFEMVISALARGHAWRRALQLLDVMDELEIPTTVVTYNTVISACARAGEVGTAKNLLFKMRKHGVQPNVISFNSVMTACASTSQWKDALAILDQCHREPGVQPDIITYTNAMRACAKGRQTNRALALLQVVKDRKLPVDNYCYTAVIDACGKAKMWRRALELLDEMERDGIMPNEITYSVAINACGNGGQWERSLELLEKMKEKNMRINLITYNSAITALSKASKMNAKSPAKTNTRSQTQSQPASSTDSEDGHVDTDQLWIRALELIEQIKADGMEPDGFSYSAAISCCGAGGRWKEALDLIKTMQKGGPKMRPNKIAYTAAISACGRSGEYEEALKLFTDMKNQGLQPDSVSYNALFSALRIANKPQEAFELWREMCREQKQTERITLATAKAPISVSPDIITLTDVIGTLSRAEKVDKNKIDQVFQDAVERGIVLRKDSLDSDYEVDLTGMSLPVARAACRFIFQRILQAFRNGEAVAELTLITGVGWVQQQAGGKDKPQAKKDQRHPTALREYILHNLQKDFDPPMCGIIPPRAQGTVVIEKGQVEKWIAGQRR